ncbi:hypothetical protein Pcinc_036008 [Petrolisthes cinctipes]|uniref:Uncharacterized protein n=1 Tax=Petrolisthes cinctipes TaxID=88211 RepID=A0AAE1EPP6_PETCI|nr:hypothetical protein Pcinc_036008 [Petrolisthes cinctipes]
MEGLDVKPSRKKQAGADEEKQKDKKNWPLLHTDRQADMDNIKVKLKNMICFHAGENVALDGENVALGKEMWHQQKTNVAPGKEMCHQQKTNVAPGKEMCHLQKTNVALGR